MSESEAPSKRLSEAPSNPPKRPSLLMNPGINVAVPSNEDALNFAHNVHGEESWQTKTLQFMHRRPVQFFLMGLLLLDVVILFIDLFLLAAYPSCTIIERDGISCCPKDLNSSSSSSEHGESEHRFLSGGGEVCEYPYEDSHRPAGCDDAKYHNVHVAEEVLVILSIIILSILLSENVIQIVVLTPQVFFRHVWYVMDFVIISVSLGLEITFLVLDDQALISLVGLLVLSRIWRFVRISHGLVEVAAELSSQKFHALLEYAEELEALLRKEDIPIPVNETVERYRQESIH